MSSKNAGYVMLVLKDRTRCDKVSGWLGAMDFSVRVCHRAEDAMAGLNTPEPPRLIVTEPGLSGMDGLDFCRSLRFFPWPASRCVPVVMLASAWAGVEAGRLADTLGVAVLDGFSMDGDTFKKRVLEILDRNTECDGENKGLRVLLAMDCGDLSENLRGAFQAQGYDARAVLTAEQGLQVFGEQAYDLAVVDLAASWGSSLFDRLLAQRPGFPVVAICDTSGGHFRQVRDRGAADCLCPPFDPDYLVDRCYRIIKERCLGQMNALLEKRVLELKASEDDYKAVFETFEDLFYRTDLNGMVTMISPSVYRLSGWTQEEIVGKPVTMVYDQPGARDVLLAALTEKGCLRDYELCLVKKDGSRIFVSLAAQLVRDSCGAVTGVVGSLRDIAHRKQIEQALKESEEKFRILTESSPAAIMLYQNDKWVYVNSAAVDITGYTIDEFRSMDFWEIVHPDDREMIRHRGTKRQQGDTERARYEFKIVSKSGTVKWVYLSGAATLLNGKPAGIISVLDISSRKQIEESLRKSEERFRTILDEMEVGYLEIDLEGHLVFSNEAFQRIFGYGRRNGKGPECLPAGIEDGIAQKVYQAYQQMIGSGFSLRGFEWEAIREDGTRGIFELSASVLKDIAGKPVGYRGIVRDITERRRADEEREQLQTQLNQIQKMDSVGRLAGGVAHDFNNMLGVILGRTEIGLMKVDPGQSLHQDLEEIRKAAERSSDLTRQLLAFARKQTVDPRVLDLNQVVAGMLQMIQRLIGEHIDLAFLPARDLPLVKMDPSQIDQILANLCVNARDAMSGGGKITIETGTVNVDEEACAKRVGLTPGTFVCLSVTDDGCGMDGEVRDKLFEPFFTTKADGLGTGLGLSTVYGIVKQNQGFLELDSAPGQGSTFRICFPVHHGRAELTRDESQGEAASGAGTILLVEDEPMILEMTGMMLEHLGYRVLSTGRPSEAIRLVETWPDKIHLLLTDVVMPGMNGRDLATALGQRYPEMKCLFMSGYTADVIACHGVLEEGVFFIQKPFTMKDLAAKVREALGVS